MLQSTSPHQPFHDKLPAIDERRQHAKLQKATQVSPALLMHVGAQCHCHESPATLASSSSTCDGLLGTQVAQEKVERQGLGVSKEGQQIFDCIYKTLPCKWQEKTIIVLNEVSLRKEIVFAPLSAIMVRPVLIKHTKIYSAHIHLQHAFSCCRCMSRSHMTQAV